MSKAKWLLASLLLVSCQSQEVKVDGSHITLHGHRGSRGTHPENTLPALEEAVNAGAGVLEFDLHLTREDVPILTHEPVVSSSLCVDSKGKPPVKPIPIRKSTLSTLQKFDCGVVPQPRFPNQKKIPHTKMPSLEEVLRWVVKKTPPSMELNIETKMEAPSPDLVPDPNVFAKAVIRLLRKYGLVERSILQSFDFRTLEAAKKMEPRLRLSALFEKGGDLCGETLRLGAKYVSPDFTLVTHELVKDCHSKGLLVVPWTLNTPELWKKATDLGVDGIITDYPRELKAFLTPLTPTK